MPPEARAEGLAVGEAGERIGDRAVVALALQQPQPLDRAHQAQRPVGGSGRIGGIMHRTQADRIPAPPGRHRRLGRIERVEGGDRKFDPPRTGLARKHRADVLAQRGGVIGLGQIRNVGEQQRRAEIEPQFRDVARCVNDKPAPVDPDHDIAGRFLDQAMQHTTFNVTQTNFHTDSAPAVQRKVRQLALSQIYLVTNESYSG